MAGKRGYLIGPYGREVPMYLSRERSNKRRGRERNKQIRDISIQLQASLKPGKHPISSGAIPDAPL